MQVIPPDFTRRITLEGVGPCPRPVDIDQAVTGFKDLVSLRIYRFAGEAPILGEAEGDEVLIVLLAGAATVNVTGANDAEIALSEVGERALYLPAHHHYRLLAHGTADVAYARARPTGAKRPKSFAGPRLVIDDHPDRLQLVLVALSETPGAIETGAGTGTERLAFVTGPATSSDGTALAPWSVLALAPGETASLTGSGEMLVVASA